LNVDNFNDNIYDDDVQAGAAASRKVL
jgi:hypothetical protein